MTKRRLEDEGFANVLRQKPKEDPNLKQQIAQNTFALLMKAQKRTAPKVSNEPSYKYFNAQQNSPPPLAISCYRCSQPTAQDKCTYCENTLCQDCLQQCSGCQYSYCSACSILDYSLSSDQVFCISCKQG